MPTINLGLLRRVLAVRGLTPATEIAEASGGRTEEACLRPAQLIEGDSLAAIAVGSPEPWTEPVAFLDGVQRSTLVAYAGAAPLIVAEIAAGVRERRDARLATVVEERQVLAIARPSALAAAGDALDGIATLALPEDEPPHPVRDLFNAGRAVDRARGSLELAVAARFRARSNGWLLVDGALSESPAWAEDPRIIGIAKSHATLPFEGEALERYLRLPPGHRSSIYAPATRSVAPVRAWALRLWPWEGRDLFYGLVRVEVAPVHGTPDAASLLSRRLLAERAPISTPDPRWDRVLYGIHSVEQYLRTRALVPA
ncbi:MAG TPA: hypothetical protein VFZ26_00265 [Gemmatimonadales bacterium]